MLNLKELLILPFAVLAIGGCATSATSGKQSASNKSEAVRNSEPVASQLAVEVERMDRVLFDAFNSQDLGTLRTLFTTDLEFYQDNEGVAGYKQTMDDFKSMFEQNSKIRRELVKGSLEIYPIKNYGAIEVGVHKFCHIENGKDECGTFKFVHVWQNENGDWKLSRVVSYNH